MEEFDDGPILGSNFSFWFILRGSIYASEDASQLSAIKKRGCYGYERMIRSK